MIKPHGVILVVECDKTLLFVQECKSKPRSGKFEGMIGPPCETGETGENSWDTLKRLLYEEIGVDIEENIRQIPGILEFTHITADLFYVLVAKSFIVRPYDDEIKHYGWLSVDKILSLDARKKRNEVDAIMEKLLSYKQER